MKHLFLIIPSVLFFYTNQVYAQQDLIFHKYPNSDNVNSVLLNLSSTNDTYYLLQNNFSDNSNDFSKDYTSIIKTDLNGFEIARLDSIVINDYKVPFLNHIFSTDDGIILVSTIVNQGGANTYSSYKVDLI